MADENGTIHATNGTDATDAKAGDANDTGAVGTTTGETEQAQEQAQAQERRTLDDALRDREVQAEFDKRMAKALQTARGKWEREAKMTAEERAAATLQERENQLGEREAALRQRELAAHAGETLRAKGLPDGLLTALGGGFADERDAEARVSALEKAYRKSVDAAVQERMRGSAPRDTPADADAAMLAQMRKAAGLK